MAAAGMIWSEPELETIVVHKSAPYDVYIGRPSKWGNPFPLTRFSRSEAIQKYSEWIVTQPELINSLYELRGKRLGCWCKPAACHGDVLVNLIKDLEEKI